MADVGIVPSLDVDAPVDGLNQREPMRKASDGAWRTARTTSPGRRDSTPEASPVTGRVTMKKAGSDIGMAGQVVVLADKAQTLLSRRPKSMARDARGDMTSKEAAKDRCKKVQVLRARQKDEGGGGYQKMRKQVQPFERKPLGRHAKTIVFT